MGRKRPPAAPVPKAQIVAAGRTAEARARGAEAKAKREELLLEHAQAKHRQRAAPALFVALPPVPSVRALAATLGISETYVRTLAKRPWFPKRGAVGWDEIDVRDAIREYLPTGRTLVDAAQLDAVGGGHATALEGSAGEAIRILTTSVDPLELAKAGAMIQARKLAESYVAGDRGSREINGLKMGLAEWRTAESMFMDLARKRGELVPRETVEIVGATLAGYLLRALESADTMLAAQVERWHGGELDGLDTVGRAQAVGRWARRRSRELREAVADELTDVVADALREAGAA